MIEFELNLNNIKFEFSVWSSRSFVVFGREKKDQTATSETGYVGFPDPKFNYIHLFKKKNLVLLKIFRK